MRYPIYIPTKGRSRYAYTTTLLKNAQVSYRLVVEPQDFDAYAAAHKSNPYAEIIVLPQNAPHPEPLTIGYVRKWIKQHARNQGYAKHWQIDDDMKKLLYQHKGKRIEIDPAVAIVLMENFSDNYQSINVAGPQHKVFPPGRRPLNVNSLVSSWMLIDSFMDCDFRTNQWEDADICLQSIINGGFTMRFNYLTFECAVTKQLEGGNTPALIKDFYDEGRAKALAALWPRLGKVVRREDGQYVFRIDWGKLYRPLIPIPLGLRMELPSIRVVDAC